MTAAYLSLIESGQRTPSESALGHIATRLGVTDDELLTGRPPDLEARLELALQNVRAVLSRGELDAAQHELQQLIRDSRRHNLLRLHARAVTLLAAVAERRGNTREARDLYDEAQQVLSGESPHLRFEATVGFARCTQYVENPRLAVHLLEAYLKELEQARVEDPTAKMRALGALVHLYKAIGWERRAIESAEEALTLAPRVEDPEQIACMNMNVARSLLDQGRHSDAIEALRSAERVYQQLDWPIPEVRSKINRGIVQVSKGAYADAADTFLGALRILDSLHEMPGQDSIHGALLNHLGEAERLLGDPEAAIRTLRKARKIIPEDDAVEIAYNARQLGLALAAAGGRGATSELRRSSEQYREAGLPREAAQSLLELGRLLRRAGDMNAAAKALEEGLELSTMSIT